ncbi:hypothetical protein TrLO_g5846 [Triparma laevis f. longispina]|uniref:Pseudouridine synthase RsuA/RluA-like domain-containing protein n=1 Tax=Triparma laevis f. longispina TaxID=1714387 RepID=A0A9W6ZFZ3_9STRA|nr:hypothetical protein TrLO_g5846 [Triparma laevis f. longispina]
MICSLSGTAPNLQNITPPLPIDYHPVGRLDEHSHGLFIFSKDSRITDFMLSPGMEVERVYRIIVKGDVDSPPFPSIISQVSTGVKTSYGIYSGFITSYSRYNGVFEHEKCGVIGKRSDVMIDTKDKEYEKKEKEDEGIKSEVTIKVSEGKNRMVRRLFAHLNFPVLDLQRISYGPVTLPHNLKPGEWRIVSDEDVIEWEKVNMESWESRKKDRGNNKLKIS